MKFFGTDADISQLRDSQENLVDTLLFNAFNAGYKACNNTLTEMYNQAKKAVEQEIDPRLLRGQNPFIDILSLYVDSRDKSGEMVQSDLEPNG